MGANMNIQGSVAAILNERELVLNRGADAGVTLGMRFKVLDHERSIMDPETKTLLTTLQREKIRVKVIEVGPSHSIANTYQTYTEPQPADPNLVRWSNILGNALGARNHVTKVRTFRRDGTVSFSPIDESDSIVKVSDPVMSIDDEV